MAIGYDQHFRFCEKPPKNEAEAASYVLQLEKLYGYFERIGDWHGAVVALQHGVKLMHLAHRRNNRSVAEPFGNWLSKHIVKTEEPKGGLF